MLSPSLDKYVRCDECKEWSLYDNTHIRTPFTSLKNVPFTCRLCKLETKLVASDHEIQNTNTIPAQVRDQVSNLELDLLSIKEDSFPQFRSYQPKGGSSGTLETTVLPSEPNFAKSSSMLYLFDCSRNRVNQLQCCLSPVVSSTTNPETTELHTFANENFGHSSC
jgi:hypothetical protein